MIYFPVAAVTIFYHYLTVPLFYLLAMLKKKMKKKTISVVYPSNVRVGKYIYTLLELYLELVFTAAVQLRTTGIH